MSAETVAAILLAFELTPLGFFNLTRDGGNNHVALQLYACTLQGFYGMRVADQRALHVVDTEAVNHAVLNHRMRFVSDTGQKFLVAGIGSIHVAVEHQVLAASGTRPASDHIRAAFLDLLPGDIEPKLLQRALHILRHLHLIVVGDGAYYDLVPFV